MHGPPLPCFRRDKFREGLHPADAGRKGFAPVRGGFVRRFLAGTPGIKRK